ncbi:hypothetical protein EQG63_11165 [Flavobacterium amnicola]|uniref:Lipoprotein n=1 Tax=Flavobacterium amnicola TaxID=2506422 RepID=A0A4Q1K159_9FLAO|nr:hypothetical protein [Flavobacterium amnicola]RXR17341.1 hypothetical protein EQG63_11165 [Flavobacterium amnicola]
MSHLRLIISVAFYIFISCKQNEESYSKSYLIKDRGFSFFDSYISKYDVRLKKVINDDYSIFIYQSDYIDTLKIENQKLYYRNKLLKIIDSKNVKYKDSIILINKCFFENKVGRGYEMNLFINRDKGLLFTESLDYGLMTEYDIEKYHEIHKKIALRQLGFKDGKYELQFAKMNYPELNNK